MHDTAGNSNSGCRSPRDDISRLQQHPTSQSSEVSTLLKLKDEPSASTKDSVSSESSFISEQKIINERLNSKLSSLSGVVDKFDNFTARFSKVATKLKSDSNEKHTELIIAKNELQVLVVKIISTQEDLAKKNAEFLRELAELKDKTSFVECLNAKLAALEVKFDDLLSTFDKKLSIDTSATEKLHTFASDKYSLFETTCIEQQGTLIQMLSDQKKLTEENIWLLDEQAELRHKLAEVEKPLADRRSDIREQKLDEESLPNISSRYDYYKIAAIATVINCVFFPLFRFISYRVSK